MEHIKSINDFLIPAMVEYLKQFDENPLKNVELKTDIFENYGSGDIEFTIFVKRKQIDDENND
jgi:hypothetical protein